MFGLTSTQQRIVIGAVAGFFIALVPVFGLSVELTTAIQSLIGLVAGMLIPKV